MVHGSPTPGAPLGFKIFASVTPPQDNPSLTPLLQAWPSTLQDFKHPFTLSYTEAWNTSLSLSHAAFLLFLGIASEYLRLSSCRSFLSALKKLSASPNLIFVLHVGNNSTCLSFPHTLQLPPIPPHNTFCVISPHLPLLYLLPYFPLRFSLLAPENVPKNQHKYRHPQASLGLSPSHNRISGFPGSFSRKGNVSIA